MRRLTALAAALSLAAPGPAFAAVLSSGFSAPDLATAPSVLAAPAALPRSAGAAPLVTSLAAPSALAAAGLAAPLAAAAAVSAPAAKAAADAVAAAPAPALSAAAAPVAAAAAAQDLHILGLRAAQLPAAASAYFDQAAPRAAAAAATASAAQPRLTRPLARTRAALAAGAGALAFAYSRVAQALPDAYDPSVSQTPDTSGIVFVTALLTAIVGGVGLALFWLIRDRIRAKRAMQAVLDEASDEEGYVAEEGGFATLGRRPTGEQAVKEKPLPKVTFADVAGQDDAKKELQRVVRYLKNPEKYRKLKPNFKGFKGVLLYGPPGTGKTLLARALAAEAGVPFLKKSGASFVEVFVGNGAKHVREAFSQIRKMANGGPAILFIDEIDALRRRQDDGKGNSEDEKTINEFLNQMDGFEKDNIIIVGATNRPDMLDPALTRGGRFGLKVPVGLPDLAGRRDVLKVHTAGMALAPDVDIESLAKQTPRLSGADLEQIVEDATVLAGDRDADAVSMADFVLAIDRLTVGHERKRAMTEKEKRVVSYHESGHALASHLLEHADPVRKVTIVPTGLGALGLMQSMAEEERTLESKSFLLDQIATALGGRVAEEMMTQESYSGAASDFEQATRMARFMAMKYGMVPELGYVTYDFENDRFVSGRSLSERTRARIDRAVEKILKEQGERVRKLLADHKPVLQAMSDELMEKETLRGADLDRLIPNGKKTPVDAP